MKETCWEKNIQIFFFENFESKDCLWNLNYYSKLSFKNHTEKMEGFKRTTFDGLIFERKFDFTILFTLIFIHK